ncbi:MAG: glycosyltransferase family 4 protein [Phormidesmis sp. RL_2_1]|nr:glycosyltransferase family 4 protein [Phormidesmis sp. RL_2_1]
MVRFDGGTIKSVDDISILKEKNRQNSRFGILLKKISSKIVLLLKSSWIYQVLKKTPRLIAFNGKKLAYSDYYLVADANWDLSDSYFDFLKKLNSQGVHLSFICYDLIPLRYPQFCSPSFSKSFSDYLSKGVPLYEKVVCISQTTSQDFQEAQLQGYVPKGKPQQLVTSFKLGSDLPSRKKTEEATNAQDAQERIRFLLNKSYLLVVGSLSPHKNAKAIVSAFNVIASQHPDLHLVFAGNRGWHVDTDQLIEAHDLYQKRIHILGSVTDGELKSLYKGCFCLIQASFCEGFGLPVVEALYYRKPVLASNVEPLPEIGGEFCLYFEPSDYAQLSEHLLTLLDSEAFYNAYLNKLESQYMPFSWKESAYQLLKIVLD